MIENWARLPVAIAAVAVLAMIATMLIVGGGFTPMMAGPEEAR